ncbi:hypothetical protein FDA33_17390 [Clostridium botulinum]|uniref:Uncharacterized protein n=1 Tax=Clostridium botulinum TaxID=1491 RepID=A0A6B4JJE2_CLOBO|nr:hypothetical protein [Clostridium botulinum]EES51330.1 hypothetical protein CLO_1532 [Clostridium botulinum E1 str. 'BoNT E Beluga']MBY6760678.1 hypothetical protein [Clostridium botulinum]MBY6915373.1 hypothetical protein [Clostridium botulinum]MBY6919585.1 hypothetical protein [Clostridium botulinum]MCR1130464.1 hypothetical protein [Clostridium botulinum]
MKDESITEKIEILISENIRLKNRNAELLKQLGITKSWTGIRESILIPKLKERYGVEGHCLYSAIATKIGDIVKENIGVAKFTEINESNYEYAKELAIALVDTFCKFEWPHLKKLKIGWNKF